MSFPEPARGVVEQLAAELPDLLGPNLVGLYVYGSLAFGCYNPARSDVDVLVVTRRRIAAEARPALSDLLHTFSNLEITFFSRADLDPWRYPCPYDLHHSDSGQKQDGAGVDFAAEITNARTAGVALVGPLAVALLPEVPAEDYVDCVVRDIRWARALDPPEPVYLALSCCRALAFARTGTVMSKAEGAEWAANELPDDFRPLASRALTLYRDGAEIDDDLDMAEVLRFSEWVEGRL
jgi:predicted nucleotidyltransferase